MCTFVVFSANQRPVESRTRPDIILVLAGLMRQHAQSFKRAIAHSRRISIDQTVFGIFIVGSNIRRGTSVVFL